MQLMSAGAEIALGVILLIPGIAGLIYVRRKRFYRRGPGGLQHYSNFRESLVTGGGEWLLRVISWFLVIAGASLIIHPFIRPYHHPLRKKYVQHSLKKGDGSMRLNKDEVLNSVNISSWIYENGVI